MKKIFTPIQTVLLLAVFMANSVVHSQTPTPPAAVPPASTFGIKFSGFVKTDYFYDSRQTLTLREGDVLFLPAAYAADKGTPVSDRNAVSQFGATVLQTRLRGDIAGPDFFGMKTSGVLEGEFLGPDNTITVNSFRIRHAFVKLTGTSVEMLFGQYWHPFFNPDCFPGTYNFSTGFPFATIARNPQFKISSVGATKVYASILAERDFADSGPGTANANTNLLPALQKNSGLPIFAAGVQHNSSSVAVGVNATYKTIRPSIVDNHGVADQTNLSTLSLNAYFKYKAPSVTFKLATIYGSNLSDILMAGGYAISDTMSAVAGVKDNLGKTYTPISSMNTWAELEGGSSKFEWGLFIGYLTTLGAADPITAIGKNADGTPAPIVFGFSFLNDVKSAYRVSPRMGWKSGKLKIGIELDYTSVTRGEYNLTADSKNLTELTSNSTVANLRVLATAMYNF